MGRMIIRLMVRLMLLYAGLTGGIRLLADDSAFLAGLRAALLESPGCQDNACYLGIRPGATTMRAAYSLLREHLSTVRADFLETDHSSPNTLTWEQASPYFPRGRIESLYRIALVDFIWLPSDVTLGEMWLAFEAPRAIALYDTFQVARYRHFSVQTATACRNFWWQQAEILISDRQAPDNGLTLFEARREICRMPGVK